MDTLEPDTGYAVAIVSDLPRGIDMPPTLRILEAVFQRAAAMNRTSLATTAAARILYVRLPPESGTPVPLSVIEGAMTAFGEATGMTLVFGRKRGGDVGEAPPSNPLLTVTPAPLPAPAPAPKK